MFKKTRFLWKLILLSTLLGASIAQATNFRYGHISWKNGATANSVEVRLLGAWRRNAYTTYNRRCINPVTMTTTACTGPGGSAGLEDIIIERQSVARFNWGDGSATVGSSFGPLLYLVKAIDPVNNWLSGEAVDPTSLPLANIGDPIDTILNHIYSSAGTYTASSSSCCRISRYSGLNEHINNPDGYYKIETTIELASGNNSPSSTQNPIVLCPINSICSITIPATDIDGDTVSFRMATSPEAGGYYSSFRQPGSAFSGAPNPAFIDPLTGVYTWDTTGATLARIGRNTLYSTQVILEDGTTKVPLDFLIQLTTLDPNPPVITPPTGSPPICSTTQVVTLGNTINFGISASDPDSGDIVTLNSVGLPSGSSMSPTLPILGNPIASSFSWTPNASQVGNIIVSFSAASSAGGFAQCPVTIEVIEIKTCDADGDKYIDKDDISLIMAARNTFTSIPNDPRDADKDGAITVSDARQCVLKCDLNNCQVH